MQSKFVKRVRAQVPDQKSILKWSNKFVTTGRTEQKKGSNKVSFFLKLDSLQDPAGSKTFFT